MKSRCSVVMIDGFYQDPDWVRGYALRQKYYFPYEDEQAVRQGRQRPTWWASRFRNHDECPFKSSAPLVQALEEAVSERVDLEHWQGAYPVDKNWKPIPTPKAGACTCLWNCCFHVKPDNGQKLGDGVHNHVTDSWNSVGPEGWAGIIYLNSAAPLSGGLHLWRNTNPEHNFDWMTPAREWELVDAFGNVCNRLVLVRGDVPHSGAGGWGDRLENGRMYQTFFFKTTQRRRVWPVSITHRGD